MNTQTKTVAQVASELGLTAEEVVGLLDVIGVQSSSVTSLLSDDNILELKYLIGYSDATIDSPASAHQGAGIVLNSNVWTEVIDRLDPRQSISLDKPNKNTRLRRTWRPVPGTDKGEAVWTKTHQRAHDGSTNNDLNVFLEWENNLVGKASQDHVSGCVELVFVMQKGSEIRLDGTPRVRRLAVLQTKDAGPDLATWALMKPWNDGRFDAHPFVHPLNYLRLIRGILEALHSVHQAGLIHCDLHAGNIALPAKFSRLTPLPGVGEQVRIEPQWDQIRIIDLDFSASKWAIPYCLPMLKHRLENGQPSRRMSDHLRRRIDTVDAWLTQANSTDQRSNRAFWNEHGPVQLKCLQELDWREDFYQLGYLLKDIRDSWRGAAHVLTLSGPDDVSNFIKTFPENLMKWGEVGESDWDPVGRTSLVPAPPTPPHRDYINLVGDLISKLDPGSAPLPIFLRRVHHDPEYAAAHEEQQRHLLEQERRTETLRKFEEELKKQTAASTEQRLHEQQQVKEQGTARQTDQLAKDERDRIAREEAEEMEAARLQAEDVERQRLKREQEQEQERHLQEVAEAEARNLAGAAIHSTGPKPEAMSVAIDTARERAHLVIFLATSLGTSLAGATVGWFMVMLGRIPTNPLFFAAAMGILFFWGGLQFPSLYQERSAAHAGGWARLVVLLSTSVLGASVAWFWLTPRWTQFAESPLLPGAAVGFFALGAGSASYIFRIRAGAAHAAAMYKLGVRYGNGQGGLPMNQVQAVAWYRKAAEAGNVDAMCELGVRYESGIGGLPVDEVQAVAWYRKAAKAGSANAMYRIGVYHDTGRGVLPKDEVKAAAWYRDAANAGDVTAMCRLGGMCASGRGGLPKDDGRAIGWYRKAADAGSAAAMHWLGLRYESGRGGLPKDDTLAVAWYRKAADAGADAAMCKLGVMYIHGRGGLPTDDVQAAVWLGKAAASGDVPAMFWIGSMYADGRGGLPRNEVEAEAWFRKAAHNGNVDAMRSLETMYAEGRGGLPKDAVKAGYWLRQAAESWSLPP